MANLEDDLRAAVAADRELGGDYEAAVARALGERLDREIDRRVAERVDALVGAPRRHGRGGDFLALLLALASIGMGLGVPNAMNGAVGGAGTFVLTLIAWLAIAAIDVAYAWGRR